MVKPKARWARGTCALYAVQQLRMLLYRPLVQSHRVADVCVRIDETGNQISPAHIDSSRPGGRTEIGAHRRDPPVPNDDVNVLERLLAFRRNERGVLDDDTVQHRPAARSWSRTRRRAQPRSQGFVQRHSAVCLGASAPIGGSLESADDELSAVA